MTGLLRRRPRKGPGLAPHVPMPPGATGTAAGPDFSLSQADLDALEIASAKVPVLGPAARSRGRHLAGAMRNALGDDAALRELLRHLHWMESVHRQGIFPATWGQHICAVLAACHELNGGAPPEWTDEQVDRLAETLRKEGEER